MKKKKKLHSDDVVKMLKYKQKQLKCVCHQEKMIQVYCNTD